MSTPAPVERDRNLEWPCRFPRPSSSQSASSVVEESPLPFAEGVTPPKTEKLFLPIDAHTDAVVEITIKTRGLGAIDPPTRRAPTAKELHQVAGLLTRRVYQFTESGD